MKKSKTDAVRNFILKNINNGVYKEGQMVDSEPTLVKKLGVSRVTVREAIRGLVEENILQKQQGRGTFVIQQPLFDRFQSGIGFSKETIASNTVHSEKNVKVTSIVPSNKILADLHLPPNSEVWFVSRLRLVDDKPMAVEHEYFAKNIVLTLPRKNAESSIHDYLETQGISSSHVDQIIETVEADGNIAKQLEVEQKTPLARIYLIAYLKNGTPFNCGYTYYRKK